MLTRHLVPTSGDAFISDHSILSDFTRGAGHMGVVTQSNSLWDRLSVRDHLYLFARLRGVPAQVLDDTVTSTLQNLELWSHRDKLAMSLSGGMKRKLCVAIALIGDPEVVLLDEPSAGLDPVSRRNLWRVILTTMSNRAVILTTHSMEEAEALCRRIGIMVLGQMRCLGSKQHLKNKFGSGFELTVKMLASTAPLLHRENSPMQAESESKSSAAETAVAASNVSSLNDKVTALHQFLASYFPSITQIAQNGSLLTFQIPKAEIRLGLAFSVIEDNKERLEIEDYVIAQPTLEQVFIRTVRRFTPDDHDDKKKGKRRRKKKTSAAAADGVSDVPVTLGGTVRMSIEGSRMLGEVEQGADKRAEASNDLGNLLRASIMSLTGQPVEGEDDDEYEDDDEDVDEVKNQPGVSLGGRLKYLCCDSDDRNKCGCTNFCVKMLALFAGLIALIFIVSAFAEGATKHYKAAGFLWTLGIIAIIVSCCGCNILFCACCQYPKDIE
jgi:ABC-type multidrug transport system ATPase subunit